jgi:hypothetical protein
MVSMDTVRASNAGLKELGLALVALFGTSSPSPLPYYVNIWKLSSKISHITVGGGMASAGPLNENLPAIPRNQTSTLLGRTKSKLRESSN